MHRKPTLWRRLWRRTSRPTVPSDVNEATSHQQFDAARERLAADMRGPWVAAPADTDGTAQRPTPGSARDALDAARDDGVAPDLDGTPAATAEYMTPWGRRVLAASVLAELLRQEPDVTAASVTEAGAVHITVTVAASWLTGAVWALSDRLDEPREEMWIGDEFVATGMRRGIRVRVAGVVAADEAVAE